MRSSNASAPVAAFSGTCGRWSSSGTPSRRLELNSCWRSGAAAGKITSAAELPLADGKARIFALGMIPREAEFLPQRQGAAAENPENLRNQPFTYTCRNGYEAAPAF
jgi:hypothetical protein